ncbi:SDR family oxidoreductase [Salmonella enterica]|nr:SDR family oxidoreductase [Salmonella enterica]
MTLSVNELPYTYYSSLKDKVVVITGGSSGIGSELVKAFCCQGSRVHFIDIDDENGEKVAACTGSYFHLCDVCDIPALEGVIINIGKEHGLDVLINNAGNDNRHDIFDVSPSYWRNCLAINLDHQFFASQVAGKIMKERRSGVIILTSSTSFIKGRPGMVGYTTSKAAISGLNRTLSREFGEFGIRVNCIVPGAISTERQRLLWRNKNTEKEIIQSQALKIELQPRDVANMALFLDSDDSRGCTSGQFIVDAGIS